MAKIHSIADGSLAEVDPTFEALRCVTTLRQPRGRYVAAGYGVSSSPMSVQGSLFCIACTSSEYVVVVDQVRARVHTTASVASRAWSMDAVVCDWNRSLAPCTAPLVNPVKFRRSMPDALAELRVGSAPFNGSTVLAGTKMHAVGNAFAGLGGAPNGDPYICVFDVDLEGGGLSLPVVLTNRLSLALRQAGADTTGWTYSACYHVSWSEYPASAFRV